MAGDEYGDDTAYCPECGAQVYLYADRCPACGAYVTPTLERRGRRAVLAAVAILVLIAFLWLLLFR